MSIGILLSLNIFPIFFDWLIPTSLRFLWVLQSLILKPSGSPPPGASAWRIKITLSPFLASVQIVSVDRLDVKFKKIKKKEKKMT